MSILTVNEKEPTSCCAKCAGWSALVVCCPCIAIKGLIECLTPCIKVSPGDGKWAIGINGKDPETCKEYCYVGSMCCVCCPCIAAKLLGEYLCPCIDFKTSKAAVTPVNTN